MSIEPGTHDQLHELHETTNRIRRLVCDVYCNGLRIALSRTQNDALALADLRLLELLEELARLDEQIDERLLTEFATIASIRSRRETDSKVRRIVP